MDRAYLVPPMLFPQQAHVLRPGDHTPRHRVAHAGLIHGGTVADEDNFEIAQVIQWNAGRILQQQLAFMTMMTETVEKGMVRVEAVEGMEETAAFRRHGESEVAQDDGRDSAPSQRRPRSGVAASAGEQRRRYRPWMKSAPVRRSAGDRGVRRRHRGRGTGWAEDQGRG